MPQCQPGFSIFLRTSTQAEVRLKAETEGISRAVAIQVGRALTDSISQWLGSVAVGNLLGIRRLGAQIRQPPLRCLDY